MLRLSVSPLRDFPLHFTAGIWPPLAAKVAGKTNWLFSFYSGKGIRESSIRNDCYGTQWLCWIKLSIINKYDDTLSLKPTNKKWVLLSSLLSVYIVHCFYLCTKHNYFRSLCPQKKSYLIQDRERHLNKDQHGTIAMGNHYLVFRVVLFIYLQYTEIKS